MIAVLLNQSHSAGSPFEGKDHADRQLACRVVDLNLKRFGVVEKAITDRALNVKYLYILSAFDFSQGDQHPLTVSFLVAVDLNTWRTSVVGENLPIALGHALIGDDVIL
jgi:hypothetical protein